MVRQRWWIEAALYGLGAGRRFTQDSPVLPDVWASYLDDPDRRCDLLIEPWKDRPPHLIADALAEVEGAETTFNRTLVVTKLNLAELITLVLPTSGWYTSVLAVPSAMRDAGSATPERSDDVPDRRLPTDAELWEDLHPGAGRTYPHPRMISTVRATGLLLALKEYGVDAMSDLFDRLREATDEETLRTSRAEIAKRLNAAFRKKIAVEWPAPSERALVYTVNRNRAAYLALEHSVKTVKADAARQLFSVSCRHRTWAVLDSGIDARHPAFLEGGPREPGESDKSVLARSRIRQTYDFSYLRELLLGRDLDRLRDRHRSGMRGTDEERELFDELQRRIRKGRTIDWELLTPFLTIPHDDDYEAPTDGHGTHVAGILGGDWEGRPAVRGVCPDIRMIDIRVVPQDGTSSEFAVTSALQFLRHLNASADSMAIHGVNMSISLMHDAANYACGRTPVCEEAERTVASGMVVVAAAGNHGYRRFASDGRETFDQFCPVSITDPGNAENVITVGSTHRIKPHTYGISYFSSRGPTGDGRNKPDLVAPGEKIFAPTLEDDVLPLDGTSMAAPHVSGAAAMLMSRHGELVGNPARIKTILCNTATDLGRERYFQGHGLVDVLRAMQSV